MIHQFTIILEDGDNTRYQRGDDELALIFQGGLAQLVRSVTGGRVPNVTVRPVEDRNPIDERARQ
jgi:hypothetical protein